ncbi:hypothetical protein Taro_044672 [Colocasia esculenta]|uniref:Uncharacterized protein n=1 Tax=Colocasia esculenta TaxID=4460 RepID=A0A843X3M9_COLES|nr:hypothetical protein [Colocasia esculenta]
MRTAHAVALRHARSFVSAGRRLLCSYRFLAFHVDPFWTQLLYFLCLALLGSAALMALEPSDPTFSPKYVDMLYLSASAVTVSGLATVEMEVLSQSQVLVYTLLMLLGGEVWVSFLGILVRLPKLATPAVTAGGRVFDHMPRSVDLSSSVDPHDVEGAVAITLEDLTATVSTATEYRCLRLLAYVVFAYMALIQVGGSLLIFLYISIVSSNSKAVLEGKGIRVLPFAVSVTISSFANGGLIPTNENMAVFRKNSAMLLLMALQVLAGNTLFPVLLRAVVLGLKALTGKTEFEHMGKSPTRVRYFHLMPGRRASSLGLTVGGLLSAQVALFCALDWRTRVLAGLGWFQKIAAALFQAANTRHAGEAAFDLSAVSPATLVLFVVMMSVP